MALVTRDVVTMCQGKESRDSKGWTRKALDNKMRRGEVEGGVNDGGNRWEEIEEEKGKFDAALEAGGRVLG